MQQKLLNTLTLQDQFMAFLQEKGRSINTVKNYRTDLQCFNQFLESKAENKEVDQLPHGWQNHYAKYLQDRYSSDNSRRRRIQTLRLFFDFLKMKGIFDSNPIKEIVNAPKFVDIPRPVPLIDVKTVWTSILQEKATNQGSIEDLILKRNQILFLLVYGAGLKVSDISKLQHEHILNFENEIRVLMTTHKKRDPYTIPLPEIFRTIIAEYVPLLTNWKERSGLNFSELLFNANPFKILSGGLGPRGIELIFKEYSKRLGIDFTPKSLRQSCVFKWIHQGHPDSLIKEWLGVTPSYELKNFHYYAKEYLFNDEFLLELYNHYNN